MMLYTGYELDEIENDPVKKKIFRSVDILVPGRYRDEMRDTGLL